MRSGLCFDFTFDLGKNPPYYILVTSIQNTGLISKSTKKRPTILGPILIYHKKDENSVKLLYDTILDSCPALSLHLKVVGADGESSLLNQTCNAFPTALLLICIRHIRENIKRYLPSSLPEKTKKSLLDEIFETPIKKRLVDYITLCEFDSKLEEFYFNLTLEKGLDRFVH